MSLTVIRLSTLLFVAAIVVGDAVSAPADAPSAQTAPPPRPDMVIDAGVRQQAIDELAVQMGANYVFPDVGEKMVAAVRAHHAAGAYDKISSARAFAELLGTHLVEVSKDKHIRVRYSREALPPEGDAKVEPKRSKAEEARAAAFDRWMSYGFSKFEKMDGNIAYLELRGFADAKGGAKTVQTFMSAAADADALIIDLRRNGGGEPAMVALISSYLFGAAKVHLNDLYYRPTNKTEQYFTNPKAPGAHYGPDKPIYILTSKRTFSAAEEFTYNMKNLKRAIIVGETTGGGANPGGGRRTGEHFMTFIPSGRAINPITKTNWEGTGVTPDVAVPADQALLTARIMATRPMVEALKDPRFREGAGGMLAELQAELDKLKAKPAQ
jgi:C-terminal processing protease CtpA/Prc